MLDPDQMSREQTVDQNHWKFLFCFFKSEILQYSFFVRYLQVTPSDLFWKKKNQNNKIDNRLNVSYILVWI